MATTRDIRIDGERLWTRLMSLAEIGATAKGGVDRQALTDGEHLAWTLLVKWGQSAGLVASTDPAANLFLTLPGSDRELAPFMIGSHIDTQPTGGRFDGAYGVLAALEAATALAESGIMPARDIVVVAWMNEEGSRFAPGMMGSEAFAGIRPLDAIRATRDGAGISVGAEIDRMHSAFSEMQLRPLGFEVHAYMEAHIEQDIVLEQSENVIGVVTGIQGKKTFEIEIAGTKGHAGTVAMADRRDAILAFARIASALEQQVGNYDAAVKFTIGRVEAYPNAPSVIAERVVFRVDLRHPDNSALASCGGKLKSLCAQFAGPCTVSVKELVSAPSNSFDTGLQDRILAAAERRRIPAMRMLSFAGHDARQMAAMCPSAMIFIPCRDGVSHDEREWAEPSHVIAGAQIMLDVLAELV